MPSQSTHADAYVGIYTTHTKQARHQNLRFASAIFHSSLAASARDQNVPFGASMRMGVPPIALARLVVIVRPSSASISLLWWRSG